MSHPPATLGGCRKAKGQIPPAWPPEFQVKDCCCEHWGACIISNCSFVWIHAQDLGLLDHVARLFLGFFKEPPCSFPQWLHPFTFPPAVWWHSLSSTPFPAFIICRFFNHGHSGLCEVQLCYSFDLHLSNNWPC